MRSYKRRKISGKWITVCPKCGRENHVVRIFCEKCGTRIKGIATPLAPDSRMATSL